MSRFRFGRKSIDDNKKVNAVQQTKWYREFIAEMLGTFFIIAIGDGAVANYALNRNNPMDILAVSLAFGIGVLIGVCFSAPISGAHLNPAVTIAMLSLGKFPFKKVLTYLVAQYLGSFLAAFIIYTVYYEALASYDNGIRVAFNADGNETLAELRTGGIFTTYPAAHVSVIGSIWDQVVATFMMMFAICAVTDEKGINTPKTLQPLYIALVVVAVIIGFGLNCGAVLNPARDLGPRVFTSLFGYGLEPFRPLGSFYWLTAGLVGPHIGAIFGAWLYEFVKVDKSDSSSAENQTNQLQMGPESPTKEDLIFKAADKHSKTLVESAKRLHRYANYDNDNNEHAIAIIDEESIDTAIVNNSSPSRNFISSTKTSGKYDIGESPIILTAAMKNMQTSQSPSSLASKC